MSFLTKVMKPKLEQRFRPPDFHSSTLLTQNNTHLKAVVTTAHYPQSTLEPTVLQYLNSGRLHSFSRAQEKQKCEK